MKQRFRFFRRGVGARYYLHDSITGRQESLRTSDPVVARRVLHARREAAPRSTATSQASRGS